MNGLCKRGAGNEGGSPAQRQKRQSAALQENGGRNPNSIGADAGRAVTAQVWSPLQSWRALPNLSEG